MRTNEELKILQALPLEVKILKTQLRIKEWYEMFSGSVYVSRSGGKDSDVLGDIVKKMYPDVPHIFVNTGLEHDSVRRHGELAADKIVKPEMRFDDVIKKYGYPVISKEVSQSLHEMRNCKNKNQKSYLSRMQKFNGEKLDKDGSKSQFNMEKWKFLLEAPFKISHMCCDIMKKKPAKSYEKKQAIKQSLER